MPSHTIVGGVEVYTIGTQSELSSSEDIATLWITNPMSNSVTAVTLGQTGKPSLPTSVISSEENVYIVGDQSNNATLWITNKNDLSTQSIKLAAGTARYLTFIGDKLCIAGTSAYPVGGLIFDIATLWIVDRKGNIISSTLLGEKNNVTSQANIISCSNGKIYIGGLQSDGLSDIASLWICDNQGHLINTVTLGENSTYSSTQSIISKFDKVYVAGNQNMDAVSVATLWITDSSGNILSTQSLGILDQNSYANSMIYAKKTLFVAGKQSTNTDQTATLWKINTASGSITPISLDNLSVNSSADTITFLGDNLYLAGNVQTPTNNLAFLWKCPFEDSQISSVALGQITSSLTAEVPKVYAMTQSGKIYIAGTKQISSNVASMWIFDPSTYDVKAIALGLDDLRSYVYGVFNPLLHIPATATNALQKFSPLNYQKGF